MTQATFVKIQEACQMSRWDIDDDLKIIIHPKLFVLHRPSKQGFYIDKDDNVILSVSECVEPEHKTTGSFLRFHVMPYWAHSHPVSEFTTFILEKS